MKNIKRGEEGFRRELGSELSVHTETQDRAVGDKGTEISPKVISKCFLKELKINYIINQRKNQR